MDEKPLNLNEEKLDALKTSIYYIKQYAEAIEIESKKEKQYGKYINEKVTKIETHLEKIKKICNLKKYNLKGD